jgi:2-polyprenyl-3-methyl-5-hydroxy-6-metoxy-1,4-benzoquinol methylase
MKQFASRSTAKELLDQDDIPFIDIKQNMKELNVINTLLGGHKISIDGFRKLLHDRKQISVCEIGCGGGDNLSVIAKSAKASHVNIQLTGIDIKKECIEFAMQSQKLPATTTFITSDYQLVEFAHKPDIIFSSLFCHHFTKAQLVTQLKWMKLNSTAGFFINDLHRHPLAYYSIKTLTKIFSSSYLVKNDAPLSVLRGFTRAELQQVLDEAGIHNASIEWKWAFRWLVMYKHE